MNAPSSSTTSAVRKASLFYFVFVMFSYTTGGPFGLETMVATSGPGMTLLYHLIIPFFWCIPVSLVSAELTTAMPVEGGFYRWTRAAFGDFLLGIRPLETRDIVGGFAGHAGITAMAIGAGQARLRVGAAYEEFLLLLMAPETGNFRGSRGRHRQPDQRGERPDETQAQES